MITHDPEDLACFGDEVFDLRDGAVTRDGRQRRVSTRPAARVVKRAGHGSVTPRCRLSGRRRGDSGLAGARRIALLAEIARAGSITQAAKAGASATRARGMRSSDMSNLAGEPLVERVTGGKGGGSTRLTAARRAAGRAISA